MGKCPPSKNVPLTVYPLGLYLRLNSSNALAPINGLNVTECFLILLTPFIMIQNLDLEEQEQLDQLKHFWNKYGNLITSIVVLASLLYAGYNGWQYWQRQQATAAYAMFDEIEKAVAAKDRAKVAQVFNDLKTQYPSTLAAGQGALLAAKGLYEEGKPSAAAQEPLVWLTSHQNDPSLQILAKLRLAGLALTDEKPDEALKWLEGIDDKEFNFLVQDRRGDIYMAKGQPAEAIKAYKAALEAVQEPTDYERLVKIKLQALGEKTAD
jgi:predicted negative regulator of RcsB-dependent stress response